LEYKKRKKIFHRNRFNRKKRGGITDRILFYFKMALAVSIIPAISLSCIFGYDFLTQCDYFRAKTLEVEGNRVLSKEEILKEAGITPGDNILSVNISMVRKKIMANPWVAEAEVGRKIPSGIIIKITEHKCIAVLDLGKKFLLNESGEIFKEKVATDPGGVPIIQGLAFSDINLSGTRRTAAFNAVMNILKLGQKSETIFPGNEIKLIRVDREIGLTIYAFDEMKTIKLGYDHYPEKFERLKNVLHYVKNGSNFPDFETVDLNNSLNRVVVSPANKMLSDESENLRIQATRGVENKEIKSQSRKGTKEV